MVIYKSLKKHWDNVLSSLRKKVIIAASTAAWCQDDGQRKDSRTQHIVSRRMNLDSCLRLFQLDTSYPSYSRPKTFQLKAQELIQNPDTWTPETSLCDLSYWSSIQFCLYLVSLQIPPLYFEVEQSCDEKGIIKYPARVESETYAKRTLVKSKRANASRLSSMAHNELSNIYETSRPNHPLSSLDLKQVKSSVWNILKRNLHHLKRKVKIR
nr:hypothetical protein L203_04897 [Cryptococcus depauperatus CBS 7841]